ncbi:MAG: hypothetical protein HGB17_00115 [Syntrophobacteraceae bacterium]|nr:hypothetical protein [Syntrophobacteraceae bacterium]
MPKIGARITDQTAEFLRSTFGSVNAGGEYIAGAFPALYQRTIRDMRGLFASGELSLMIDCHNGTILNPSMAGQHLEISVRDSMELDGTDKKWGVDRKGLLDQIRRVRLFDRACLEIWACAYWSSGPGDLSLSEYIASML